MEKIIKELYETIIKRKVEGNDGSYTKYLLDKGTNKILKKVGEECTEVVIACKEDNKEEQINEFENLIKESLINKIPLEFTIYDNGYTKNIKGTVTKIDSSLNKIFLNYNNHIFFCEIMNIKKLDYFLS